MIVTHAAGGDQEKPDQHTKTAPIIDITPKALPFTSSSPRHPNEHQKGYASKNPNRRKQTCSERYPTGIGVTGWLASLMCMWEECIGRTWSKESALPRQGQTQSKIVGTCRIGVQGFQPNGLGTNGGRLVTCCVLSAPGFSGMWSRV